MGKCCSYVIFIKLIGLVSSIFSILLLAVCGWTLANTFRAHTQDFLEPESGLVFQNDTLAISDGAFYENTTKTENGNDNESAKVIGPPMPQGDNRENELFDDTEIFHVWGTLSPDFRSIIQLCTAVAIAIGLAQLIVSLIVLCSTRKRLRGKAKFWQLVHFVIILLLLMCILVPFSYNREKDKFRGAFTFGKYIKSQVTSLIRNQYQSESDTDTDPQTIVKYLLTDLNSYYLVLSFDVIVLFHFLLISCCCIQCRAKNYYQSV